MTAIDYHDDTGRIDWEALRLRLIEDDFHNGRSTAQLHQSFVNSRLRVFAVAGGTCIGTARALSDGVGNAYVIDVWTDSSWRGRGIATRMMQRLLAGGPGQHFYLQTDDAVDFYRRLGFSEQPLGMSRISGRYLQPDAADNGDGQGQ